MATAEQYADWIVKNKDKKGTPEFETVAEAYKLARSETVAPSVTEAPQRRSTDTGFAQGLVAGAANIGKNLISASTYIPRKIEQLTTSMAGVESPLNEAVANMQQGNEDFVKSQEGKTGFGAGKLITEIAGTGGAGNVLGLAAKASKLPKLASALESGGLTLNSQAGKTLAQKSVNAATRIAGGAGVGAGTMAMIDPENIKTGAVIGGALPIAVKGAAMVGSGTKTALGNAVSSLLGLTTGTGANTVKEAYSAGKKGATSFLDNMRGKVSMDDVIAQAKQGLASMRADRANEYKSGMAAISGDKTVLDFQPVLNAVNNIKSLGNFKGQVINKNASGVVDDIANKVDEWSKLNPDEFHTPEGLDALKQAIGDIRDSAQFGTPARKAADTAYNAVKNQIVKQAPTYSKVMAGYSEASKTLTEIEKALSLGNKASADTSIRKLQSLMRNNVQTNYGNRLELANKLSEKGGVDILPSVAGQAMNSFTPRGLIGAGESGAGIMAAILNPASIPSLAAAAPFASPRLVGESAYKLGQLTGGAGNMAKIGLNKITTPQQIEAAKLLSSNPVLYNQLMREYIFNTSQ